MVSRALLLFAIFIPVTLVGASPSTAPYTFPSKQQIIAFLVETIDWYHRLAVEQEIATEPTDILLLQENRTISTQVVRFSFDFARAAAAFEATASIPANPNGKINTAASGPDFQGLVEMQAKSESEAEQAGNDLKLLEQKRLAAKRADRSKLELEIADTQSRLRLLQAISTSLQNLVEFIRVTDAGGTETDMEAFVDGLERMVPEVSSIAASPAPILPTQALNSLGAIKPAPSGILGRISDVLTLARKRRTLDEMIGLTDKLVQSSEHLRMPITKPFNEVFLSPDLLAGTFPSNDIGALQQQEARLNALTAETTKISPAMAALAKQRVLLTLYKSHLTALRPSMATQYIAAWRVLIIRLVTLCAVIAFLTGAAEVSRRVTIRHVHDSNSRSVILIGQRVLFWLTVALTVSFAFAFDLGSLATFLGLVSAGIAVALQNVILAVVGYFLLVGKLRIRVGDRVQISGVAGEVVDIGLMQFQLKEFDTATEQPTGRLVAFSNSFVFVSPATGLFRRSRGFGKTSTKS